MDTTHHGHWDFKVWEGSTRIAFRAMIGRIYVQQKKLSGFDGGGSAHHAALRMGRHRRKCRGHESGSEDIGAKPQRNSSAESESDGG